jgi:hypothetical protein
MIPLLLCACLLDVECVRAEALEQSVVEAASEQRPPAYTVTGTLAILDVLAGKGMLKTDLNKPVFFTIGRPDHFEHLSIGDRVTMQIDDEGRTVKVIKALPAEVLESPPKVLESPPPPSQ